MTHLPFTLAAYFLNALSVLSNKFLLNKAIPDPLIYVFYISLGSSLLLLGIPFTHAVPLTTFTLASFSTLLWTAGAYSMFKALKIGQVSRIIPIIGTLIPLILLVVAAQSSTVSITQAGAVAILILGMIFLTIIDWKGNFSKQEIIWEILSAIFFASSYLLLRQAYLQADFLSVLAWSRLILIPLILIILAIPFLRRKIITSHGLKLNFLSLSGLVFLGGQLSGAASEFLILYSISLANPALVNSLQGTQYIFLLILSREKHSPLVWISKIIGIGLMGIGLYLLFS